MANSKIVITFTEDLAIGSQFGISISYSINPEPSWGGIIFPNSRYFTWVASRNGSDQVSVATPLPTAGEATAINFLNAFNLDVANLITSRAGNVVTIEYPTTSDLGFTTKGIFASPINKFNYITGALEAFPNTPSINFVIDNLSNQPFSVTSTVYETSEVSICNNVKVKITTNLLATKIRMPFLNLANNQNPIIFDWQRSSFYALDIEDSSGAVIQQSYLTPLKLLVADYTVNVVSTPSGSNAIVNRISPYPNATPLLVLRYSLNNVDWQDLNVFVGLNDGSYTVYVKDQFGCSISLPFTITSGDAFTPYFKISKANSLIWAERITHGTSANYKNDENTLACEADEILPYDQKQPFNSTDIITTQFRSNYPVNGAKIINSLGVATALTVNKITNFRNLKDKRDAKRFSLGSGKTGIYYLSGNIYNYDTGLYESAYALNGKLPVYGTAGSYISIGDVWYLIENIGYDENREVDYLIINADLGANDVNIIVGSIYSIYNYDYYDFVIDFGNYINDIVQVEIRLTAPDTDDKVLLSEKIDVRSYHPKTLELLYKNAKNDLIYYSSGITHKIRVPYAKIKGLHFGESKNLKTDNNVILTDSELYEGDEIRFMPVTKELYRKILIALSMPYLRINGVMYVKNGDFSIQNAMEDTNLYEITAPMIKSENIYASTTSGVRDFDVTNTEIVGLLDHGNGYVKY